ncbi:MAG TPA: choice-of-anchor L domain-containing protein [Candidatus Obscuribacterales bacterium]
MKHLHKIATSATVALFGCGLATGAAQAITITPTNDPNLLANTIVGSGVTISNVTYNGAAIASGTFTNGLASGIGIDQGIILTSGRADLAVGPNNSDGATGTNNTPGDPDLSSLIQGTTTQDAAVLEFDFIATEDNPTFRYVFGSEEYNEYVNQFNDVFAFFVDGQNIALVPGTNTPVSINNVNGGNPLGTNPVNSQYYVNNDPSDGTPTNDIQYDGFTRVLTATAPVTAGTQHRIKLAIADALDRSLDSVVFIQAGSFSTQPPPTSVPEPSSILGVLAFGTFGAGSLLKRKQQKKQATSAN